MKERAAETPSLKRRVRRERRRRPKDLQNVPRQDIASMPEPADKVIAEKVHAIADCPLHRNCRPRPGTACPPTRTPTARCGSSRMRPSSSRAYRTLGFEQYVMEPGTRQKKNASSFPTPEWSRCPWRGRKSSRAAPSSWRRSGRRWRECGGNGRRSARCRAAVPTPAPWPGRTGGPGCACGRAPVLQPDFAGMAPAGQAPGGLQRAGDPRRLVVQVFRQVGDRRLELGVQGVGGLVGRMAEREQVQRQAAPFQPDQFLGDEGFRQPGPALQDDARLRTRVRPAGGTGCGAPGGAVPTGGVRPAG